MKEVQWERLRMQSCVENSLLPHLQIRYCYKLKSWLKSGNEANTHPITGWEKCVLAHLIQICRLQLLSWYLHFLAIQAGSSITFSLITFSWLLLVKYLRHSYQISCFRSPPPPLSPSSSSSSFPPHVGSPDNCMHCHSPGSGLVSGLGMRPVRVCQFVVGMAWPLFWSATIKQNRECGGLWVCHTHY